MAIDPKEVIKAYKTIGAKPLSGSFQINHPDGTIYCCPLTAICHAKDKVDRNHVRLSTRDICEALGISSDFLKGFVSGFDQSWQSSPQDPADPYDQGMADGIAAGIAVDRAFPGGIHDADELSREIDSYYRNYGDATFRRPA